MPFWSTQRIKIEQQTRVERKLALLVEPFDPKRVMRGAYELALGKNVLITPEGSTGNEAPPTGQALRIPPGQFALLFTESG
jgi:hypothetical protein